MTALQSFFAESTNWVLLSFIGFAVLFAKFGWSKVIAKVDTYVVETRNELDRAKALRLEAESLLDEYQERHKNAMKQAEEILTQARDQANQIRQETEADMKSTAERREKQLAERLARVEQSAREDITRQVAEVAAQTAENLIRANLKKADHERLIEKSQAAITAKAS